jgi:hypothetical protein
MGKIIYFSVMMPFYNELKIKGLRCRKQNRL